MRKLLVTAVLLGLTSTAAYAADDGFYAGVQGGYADMGYDNNDALIPFGPIGNNDDISAQANPNAIYSVDANGNPVPFQSYDAQVNSDGAAARAYIGYQFNPYFATEAGFDWFNNTTARATGIVGTENDIQHFNNNSHMVFANETDFINNTINEKAGDLLFKFMYPVEDTGLTLYAKAGGAYLRAVQTGAGGAYFTHVFAVNPTTSPSSTYSDPNFSKNFSTDETTAPIRPVYGAGFSYDLDDNWVLTADYMFIEGSSSIGNINFGSAGIAYHFA